MARKSVDRRQRLRNRHGAERGDEAGDEEKLDE